MSYRAAKGCMVTSQFSAALRWGGRAAWCCAGMCGAGSSWLDSEEQRHVGLGSAGTVCGRNGRSASSCLSPRVMRPRQVLMGRKSTSWALSEAAKGSRAHTPADPPLHLAQRRAGSAVAACPHTPWSFQQIVSSLNPALTLLDDPCPFTNAAPGTSAAGFQQPWTPNR